jgi:hypothetical protein
MGWQEASILSASLSITPSQAPRGRPGHPGSQLWGPGGRQAHGSGLQLSQTLGVCQRRQVIWVPPVLGLLWAEVRVGDSLVPGLGFSGLPVLCVSKPGDLDFGCMS